MGSAQLQSLLETIVPNVYNQPPASVRMVYPCIRFQRDGSDKEHADNTMYRRVRRYQLTFISEDPDNEDLLDLIEALPMCSADRSYVADNLNHDVFTIFFEEEE